MTPVLYRIPDRDKAKKLAKWVKSEWGPTCKDWLREGRFDLKIEDSFPLQGMLIPYHNSRSPERHFRIVLNGSMKKNDREFVIAHEIGHSFFYEGVPRTRSLPVSWRMSSDYSRRNDAEEQWCDWFAQALTGLKPPPI